MATRTPLSHSIGDMYDLVRLNEEKNLTDPNNDTVGSIKQGQEAYGPKPKITDGPEKAKVASSGSKSESGRSSTDFYNPKSKFKGSKPAKETDYDEDVEEEDCDEEDFEEETPAERKSATKRKSAEKEENLKEMISKRAKQPIMNTFENMFRKVISEDELEFDTGDDSLTEVDADEDIDLEDEDIDLEDEDLEEESDDSDVIADLKELQDKIASILSKLESEATASEEEYSAEEDEEFDQEFGDEDADVEEEEPVKNESKKVSVNKGQKLISRKNKVGNLSPKGRKASIGKNGKQAKDGKKVLTKGAKVRSSIQKGNFIS